MSKKMQRMTLAGVFIGLSTVGITLLAVGLDRSMTHTVQYDGSIYYGATALLYLIAKALMRVTQKATR